MIYLYELVTLFFFVFVEANEVNTLYYIMTSTLLTSLPYNK